MGDGIMALFGAPLAHEDHAVRACYAALQMQDLVSRYAEEVRRVQGVNGQIRVGLNSGTRFGVLTAGCSCWGNVCRHVEQEVSRFIPSTFSSRGET
jgi:class 3 adenylate cyclase